MKQQQETNPKAIIGSGVEENDSDYKRWFDNCKRTFNGVNAGEYIDKEDFEIYGRNTERTIQSLRDSNAELLKAAEMFLEAINRSPAALHHYGTAIELTEKAINKAKSL